MNIISEYWEQILLIGALIFHAARSYAQISEMRKDIDTLQAETFDFLNGRNNRQSKSSNYALRWMW